MSTRSVYGLLCFNVRSYRDKAGGELTPAGLPDLVGMALFLLWSDWFHRQRVPTRNLRIAVKNHLCSINPSKFPDMSHS
jgi:hypothetical protein